MRYSKTLLLALVASGVISATALADNTNRSAGTVIDDAAITASLKTKLIGDKDTKARQIDIETRNGVVQLNGFVDSATARAEAEKLAVATDGVKTVKNNLEVRTDDRNMGKVMDDGGLTAKVNAALAADPRTSALDVNVAVRDGDIQLSGYVKDAEARMAAAEVARSVAGARTITNSLAVR